MANLSVDSIKDSLVAFLRVIHAGQISPFPSIASLLLAVAIDRTQRRPACIVLPDSRDAAGLCAVLASLQQLVEDFETSRTRLLEEGLAPGSRVRSTADGRVYQVGSTDETGIRLHFLKKAMRESSGCRIISHQEALGYEPTERWRPMAQPDQAKVKPQPTPLDALAGVRTLGNTNVIRNRTVVLGAKEEFVRFLETLHLAREGGGVAGPPPLSEAFCWGWVTDAGMSVEHPSGALGEPLVAFTRDPSLLRRVFVDETSSEDFSMTIVTPQTSLVLSRLDDIQRVAQKQRVVLFADARRRAEIAGLAQAGWDVWELSPSEIMPPEERMNALGLGGIDVSRRAATRELSRRIRRATADCPQIEVVHERFMTVCRLLGAEDIKDDPLVEECRNLCRDMYFDAAGWLTYPIGEKALAARDLVREIECAAPGLCMLAGLDAVDAVRSFADAVQQFTDAGAEGLCTPKGEALARIAEKTPAADVLRPTVLTAHPRSSEAVRSLLEGRGLLLDCPTIADFRERKAPLAVVVVNALWRDKFADLLDPWPASKIVLAGYRFEIERYDRWLAIRDSARKRLTVPDGLRALAARIGVSDRPAPTDAGAGPPVEVDEGEDAFEKATKPRERDWTRRPSVLRAPSEEMTSAVFCRFVGHSWTALSEDHQVTRLAAGPGGRAYVSQVDASELSPGDRIVMREHGDKDAIRQIAEADVGAARYAELRERARLWRQTLEATRLPAEDIAGRLAAMGVRRNIMTIRSWLTNPERIGPRSSDDVMAIYDAFAPANAEATESDACWDAISELRGLHISAGNTLSNLIFKQCGGLLLEPSEAETKVMLTAGDAWVLEVAHMDAAPSDWPAHVVNQLQWEEVQERRTALTLADLGL